MSDISLAKTIELNFGEWRNYNFTKNHALDFLNNNFILDKSINITPFVSVSNVIYNSSSLPSGVSLTNSIKDLRYAYKFSLNITKTVISSFNSVGFYVNGCKIYDATTLHCGDFEIAFDDLVDSGYNVNLSDNFVNVTNPLLLSSSTIYLDPTVQLLPNSTNKAYYRTSGAAGTPSSATSEFTDANYASVNVSDTNRWSVTASATKTLVRFAYNRDTFNISFLDYNFSKGNPILNTTNWINFCYQGYYTVSDYGGSMTLKAMNNTGTWLSLQSLTGSEDTYCTNYTSNTSVNTMYNKTSGLMSFGFECYATGEGLGVSTTTCYANFINLTVNYNVIEGGATTYYTNATQALAFADSSQKSLSFFRKQSSSFAFAEPTCSSPGRKCRNLTMSGASIYNYTDEWCEQNVTSLTFTDINELRLYNDSCDSPSRAMIDRDIISSATGSGDGWALVGFYCNYTQTDAEHKYSLDYNNGDTSDPATTSIFATIPTLAQVNTSLSGQPWQYYSNRSITNETLNNFTDAWNMFNASYAQTMRRNSVGLNLHNGTNYFITNSSEKSVIYAGNLTFRTSENHSKSALTNLSLNMTYEFYKNKIRIIINYIESGGATVQNYDFDDAGNATACVNDSSNAIQCYTSGDNHVVMGENWTADFAEGLQYTSMKMAKNLNASSLQNREYIDNTSGSGYRPWSQIGSDYNPVTHRIVNGTIYEYRLRAYNASAAGRYDKYTDVVREEYIKFMNPISIAVGDEETFAGGSISCRIAKITRTRNILSSLVFFDTMLVEKITGAVTEFINAVESLLYGDAASRFTVAFKSIGSLISFDDSMSRFRMIFKSLQESITFDDSVSFFRIFSRAFSDALSYSDASARMKNIFRLLSDYLTYADMIEKTTTSIQTYLKSLADSFSYSDFIGKFGLFFKTTSDSLCLSLMSPSASDSVVSWWKFDGDVLDTMGLNNGTRYNFSDGYVSGKYGNALQFNSTAEQFVDVGNDSSLNFGTGNFSLEMWIKGLPRTDRVSEILLDKRDLDVGNGYVLEEVKGTVPTSACNVLNGWCTYFYFATEDGNDTAVLSNISVLDGMWHHIVIAKDSLNTSKIYIDGIQDLKSYSCENPNLYCINPESMGSIDNIGNLTISSPIKLGTPLAFNGTMDNIRIWNRSLSADEVQQLYMRDGFCKGDALTKFRTIVRSASDTIKFGDILARLRLFIISLADSINFGDMQKIFRTLILSLSEHLEYSDALERIKNIIVSVSSYLSYAESIIAQKIAGVHTFLISVMEEISYMDKVIASKIAGAAQTFLIYVSDMLHYGDRLGGVGVGKGHILICKDFDDSNQMDVFCRDINNVQYNLNCLVYRQIPFARFCHTPDDWYILVVRR